MSDQPKNPDSAVVPQRKPSGWLGILYASLILSYGYWMSFHVAGQHPTQLAERERRAAASRPVISDEVLQQLSSDPQALAAGADAFKSTCSACHGADGQGLIGPNLTDGYWLHGAKPAEIHQIIAVGVIEKGMPGWEASLGAERVKSLAAYVLTLKGKNVSGKAPQGEKLE